MSGPSSPWRLLWLLAGFGVWGSALLALYALHAVGCAFGWPAGLLRGAVLALWALHMAALAALIVIHRRHPAAGTVGRVTSWTLWAALAATAFTFAPALALSVCV